MVTALPSSLAFTHTIQSPERDFVSQSVQCSLLYLSFLFSHVNTKLQNVCRVVCVILYFHGSCADIVSVASELAALSILLSSGENFTALVNWAHDGNKINPVILKNSACWVTRRAARERNTTPEQINNRGQKCEIFIAAHWFTLWPWC